MVHLVPDWNKAYRWSSVRLIGLAASIKLALLAWPGLTDLLPAWITQTVAILALLGLLLGARLTTMEKPRDPQSPPVS